MIKSTPLTRRLLAAVSMSAAILAYADHSGAADVSASDVLETYAAIAQAAFEDSLATARALADAIDQLVATPAPETLAAAKTAWLAARVPYQQTEVYRFGNAIVDDWEGKVNAWPLDEGLIDYVESSYGTQSDENPFYAVNVIANPKLQIGGETIMSDTIDAELLGSLHEVGDVEANVATGYHAIEFLLWGQDLNGTGPGAGNRPHTDFDPAHCTGGNCERRNAYLKAAAALLITDLEEMAANWGQGGAARTAVGDDAQGLATIVTGMGSLSYGELAGERMKLGLLLHDPEEEHDCFSDNTYNSHYYDALGIANVYLGRYERVDGSVVEGASLSDLVAAKDAAADTAMQARLDATMSAMGTMRERAETVEAYDQMIGAGNDEGNMVVQAAIDALLDQTQAIEGVVGALGLGDIALEGSDSLDNPGSIFE